jgi:hypothetical protein
MGESLRKIAYLIARGAHLFGAEPDMIAQVKIFSSAILCSSSRPARVSASTYQKEHVEKGCLPGRPNHRTRGGSETLSVGNQFLLNGFQSAQNLGPAGDKNFTIGMSSAPASSSSRLLSG